MKGKIGFLVASLLAGGALVGGTFAAWAVTDNADPFHVQITPGTLDIGNDKSVTLDWGTKGLVNIEGLSIGQEMGPYEVGLRATTSDNTAFTGSLSVSMATESVAATKLIDFLHVKVYDNSTKAGDPILTVPDGASNYTVAQDIAVNSGVEKKVYFFISMDEGISPVTYNAIKNDVVTLTVDWNKGSAIQEVTAYTYYFNNADTWANVYAYAWKEADGSTNAAWPGVQMSQAKGAIYSTALGATFDKVVFNNGLENEALRKTDDLALNHLTPYWDGDSWEAAPDVSAETEYYLVGTHNEWTTSAEAKLSKNEATVVDEFTYTYKLENVVVAANTELKVVSSENEWFGQTSNENNAPNMTIVAAGTYNFYFNPAKSGANYIYAKAVSLAEVQYFLAGTHSEWADEVAYKLTAATGEIDRDPAEDFAYTYKIENVAIAAGGQLKVHSSADVWYGEYSSANDAPNITIGEAGNYDFFFNPTLSGGIHIFCQAHVNP